MKLIFCKTAMALFILMVIFAYTIFAGEEINSGYVIAYGKYIQKPYKVILINDTIFINSIPYEPRIKKTVTTQSKIEVTDKAIQQHNLIQEIGRKYGEWAVAKGKSQALKLLEDFLKKQEILESYKFDDESVWIQFKGEKYPENIMLHTWRMRQEGQLPSKEQLEQEQKKGRLKTLNEIKELLLEDGVVAFGSGYTILVPPNQSTDYITSILSVINSRNSDTEKERILKAKKIESSLIRDIIKNQASWSKVKGGQQ